MSAWLPLSPVDYSVPMRVVHVRHVGMAVPQALVTVNVRVRFTWRIAGRMLVLMMLVMNVGMGVLQRLMLMFVLVRFGEVQPHASRHQQSSGDQL